MKAANHFAKAAKATSYNMLLQLLMRLMTFGLNAVILRYISKDLLGVVNVRLTLLYSTICFLTKEAFVKACLSHKHKHDWRQVVNLMWCTVPLGVMVSVALGIVWYHVLEQPDASIVPNYGFGVVVFAVAAALETWIDPLYVTGLAFHFIKLKVIALGLWQAVKCSLTLVLVLLLPDWGIYSFATAQIVSSLVYVMAYYLYFIFYTTTARKKSEDDQFPFTSLTDFLPQQVDDKPFFDKHLVHLTWSFFKQSFLKQILTEGERYVMTFLDVLSFADQGIYDVINNLGSMVARFIFLPIEENAYIYFTQTLERGKSATEQTQEHQEFSTKVLGILLKITTLIGSIVVVFGYSNSYLVLHFYGGSILSTGSGPFLLQWYCLYVLLIAVNGVTEGFVFATMSKQQVDIYNQKMMVFSVVFLTAAWWLTTQLGSVGFILANCLNMALRIQHSVVYIRKFFETTSCSPVAELVPSRTVLVALVLSFGATAVSESYFVSSGRLVGSLIHISVSAACLLGVMAAIYFTETRSVSFIRDMLTNKLHPN